MTRSNQIQALTVAIPPVFAPCIFTEPAAILLETLLIARESLGDQLVLTKPNIIVLETRTVEGYEVAVASAIAGFIS
jgi:hypothetical protein